MNFNRHVIKASHLTVFIGKRTFCIDLDMVFDRKRGLDDYMLRYEEQIGSLFQILDLMRRLSEAPNPMDGDFKEEEIQKLFSYMPELVDKLTTLLSIAERTFSIRPAYRPEDL